MVKKIKINEIKKRLIENRITENLIISCLAVYVGIRYVTLVSYLLICITQEIFTKFKLKVT